MSIYGCFNTKIQIVESLLAALFLSENRQVAAGRTFFRLQAGERVMLRVDKAPTKLLFNNEKEGRQIARPDHDFYKAGYMEANLSVSRVDFVLQYEVDHI